MNSHAAGPLPLGVCVPPCAELPVPGQVNHRVRLPDGPLSRAGVSCGECAPGRSFCVRLCRSGRWSLAVDVRCSPMMGALWVALACGRLCVVRRS